MERPSCQLFKAIGEERQTSAQRLENDTLKEWKSLLEKIPFSSVSYDSNGFNYNGGLRVDLCHQDCSDDCFHDYFSINAYFRKGGMAFIESCEVEYVEGGKISK